MKLKFQHGWTKVFPVIIHSVTVPVKALIVAGLLLQILPAVCEQKPNILLIMTDDQGFGDLSSHGNTVLETPAMDSLAADGARFNRFFVSPVCAPTRASLLTGRYHLATGTSGVTRNLEAMRSGEITIAEILRENGYKTGCFGKWHNGAHYPEHPNGQGFDEFFGFCGGVTNNYFNPTLEHNGKAVQTQGYISDLLTNKTMDFMWENKERPFFCYLAYNAPHTPCQIGDTYFNKYKKRGCDDRLASIYGMIENLDDNLKRLLRKLQTLKIEKRTIVLFLTDNGPNGKRYNTNMKGSKGSVDEGGVRVPFFMRWPGRIQRGRVIAENAAHIDLLPTIADLCNIPVPHNESIDGKSLKPLLLEGTGNWPDRKLFTFPVMRSNRERNRPGAVRTQRWRAIKKNVEWQLYDIVTDPGQTDDLAEADPGVLQELRDAYERKYRQVIRGVRHPTLVQIGHPEAPVVTLPAHEAYLLPEPGQGISYHYPPGYANCFITGWQSKDAYAQWHVQVVREGSYAFELQYGLQAEYVGTGLQMEIGGQTLQVKMDTAYHPAIVESPFRLEEEKFKYMLKDWKTKRIGILTLPEGKYLLRLKTVNIPGGQSVDFKSLTVKAL